MNLNTNTSELVNKDFFIEKFKTENIYLTKFNSKYKQSYLSSEKKLMNGYLDLTFDTGEPYFYNVRAEFNKSSSKSTNVMINRYSKPIQFSRSECLTTKDFIVCSIPDLEIGFSKDKKTNHLLIYYSKLNGKYGPLHVEQDSELQDEKQVKGYSYMSKNRENIRLIDSIQLEDYDLNKITILEKNGSNRIVPRTYFLKGDVKIRAIPEKAEGKKLEQLVIKIPPSMFNPEGKSLNFTADKIFKIVIPHSSSSSQGGGKTEKEDPFLQKHTKLIFISCIILIVLLIILIIMYIIHYQKTEAALKALSKRQKKRKEKRQAIKRAMDNSLNDSRQLEESLQTPINQAAYFSSDEEYSIDSDDDYSSIGLESQGNDDRTNVQGIFQRNNDHLTDKKPKKKVRGTLNGIGENYNKIAPSTKYRRTNISKWKSLKNRLFVNELDNDSSQTDFELRV